jgi:hypothetical protein
MAGTFARAGQVQKFQEELSGLVLAGETFPSGKCAEVFAYVVDDFAEDEVLDGRRGITCRQVDLARCRVGVASLLANVGERGGARGKGGEVENSLPAERTNSAGGAAAGEGVRVADDAGSSGKAGM